MTLELIELMPPGDAADDAVTLTFEERQKRRQRVTLAGGRHAAIVLPPGPGLDDGARLRATDGTTVRIRAANEAVSNAVASDPLLHARACYHLGNRHVPLQIGAGWVRYQPDHVLDDMLRNLGLHVSTLRAPFVPERGAYHGGTSSHQHGAHRHSHGGHDHHHDHD